VGASQALARSAPPIPYSTSLRSRPTALRKQLRPPLAASTLVSVDTIAATLIVSLERDTTSQCKKRVRRSTSISYRPGAVPATPTIVIASVPTTYGASSSTSDHSQASPTPPPLSPLYLASLPPLGITSCVPSTRVTASARGPGLLCCRRVPSVHQPVGNDVIRRHSVLQLLSAPFRFLKTIFG
jgi:hypothetical protein